MLKKNTFALVFYLSYILFFIFACNFPLSAPYSQNQSLKQTLLANLSSTPEQAQLKATYQTEEPESARTPVPYKLQTFPTAIPYTVMPDSGDEIYNTFHIQYIAQPGDTLLAIAKRFDIQTDDLILQAPIDEHQLLPPGTIVKLPELSDKLPITYSLLPDSEIVYGPSSIDFDINTYIQNTHGYLSTYEEKIDSIKHSGSEVVQRISLESSINPRLLLAILEYQSGWVNGYPQDESSKRYPIGFYVPEYSGLYKELSLTVRQLTIGYYGWRKGEINELTFTDGSNISTNPHLNAGSIAIQYLFSTLYTQDNWKTVLYQEHSFIEHYNNMFGDPWNRAQIVEPLYLENLTQPTMELPFQPERNWSFTGGPHPAWGVGSAWGALDFAPSTTQSGCQVSDAWVTASLPGLVVRSKDGMVVTDLDGDGFEQTGWTTLYLHIATKDRVAQGTWVNTNDNIGHPSCEGGVATGTHVHISRKYNGEWLTAEYPVPFILSGWTVEEGEQPYDGKLTKGSDIVVARSDGSHTSLIAREK